MRGIRTKIAALLCTLTLGASLTACADGATGTGSDGDGVSLTFGAFPGTQSLPLFTMKEQGFDKKHGFSLDVKSFQTPAALNSAIVAGAVEAGFGSVTGMATARSQGRDVVMINRLMTTSEVVIVPEDSPVQSLADIKGEKFGAFGGTSTGAFSVLAAAERGLGEVDNLATDVINVEAPDAAMIGLLDKGELKAALPTLAGAIPPLLSGKYRVIADIREQYRKAYGDAPGTVMVTTTDGFAGDNAKLLKNFNAALKESIDYVVNTPAVWEKYVKSIKMNQPGAAKLWRRQVGGAYMGTWDDKAVAAQTKFLTQARDILGVEKTFNEVADGTFTTDYMPTN